MSVSASALRVVRALAVPLLVGLVVAAGCLTARAPGSASPAPVVPRPAGETATAASNPFRTAAPELRGPPTRLRVGAIGVDTALETLRLGAGGELRPPRDGDKAGWYADGTAPGDLGPAVLAGHVDSKRGPAVFYRLRELRAGDRIEVVRGGRTVSFTVTTTAWYPKTDFPTDRVYGPTPDRQLRLITCGGVFDRSLRSYKDNLVVYAVAG
ncbi:class F sortase [Actinoplanes sp. NPDC049118]|uniref:class F sortase n=1 Tax=Actinoplanes sp. NPDC049118 TaxID=3155769 RepID=UPI0033CFAB05